jgi:hypothetical protein
MSCACKVGRHINKIEERYGTNVRPAKKTDISGEIKTFFKKTLIGLICLPFIPVIFLYVLIRNCFTNKAISIDKLFKIK